LFVVCEETIPLLPTFTHRCKSPYGFVPKTTKPHLSIWETGFCYLFHGILVL